MKNNIKLIWLLALVTFFTACNDAIEIDQPDALTPEITFENLTDLQQGLNAVYRRYSMRNEILFNSIFADNCKPGVDNGGQLINLFNWVLPTEQGNATAIWNNYYSLINGANRIIEAAPLVEVSAADQAEYNTILGQLYALRAAAHYHLHTYYTTDYTDNSALSAIIADEVPVITAVFPRNTNEEMYNFIADDLATAQGLIPASFTDNAYLTRDFITGLRARIALLREDASGIAIADQLISRYPLANQAQYRSMFLDSDDTEVIYKQVFTPSEGLIGGIWYFTNSAGPFIEAANGLHDALVASGSGDVRLGVNINFTSSNNGPSVPDENYILINKYPGAGSPFLSNIKAMRVSEMYLIKAELQAKVQNDPAAAAQTLKLLRDARLGTDTDLLVFNNASEALAGVLNERRLELAYEGSRYLDHKRNGLGINRTPIDCEEGGSCILPASDHRFTLPIPQVEVNANPNITPNPGYGS